MLGAFVGNKSIFGAWPIVVYILLGSVVGYFLVAMPIVYAFAFIGALLVVFFTACKPELSILTIVVIISSILDYNNLPLIPLGPGSLNITDVLIMVLIPMSISKYLSDKTEEVPKSPVSNILALFLLSALFSAIYSIVFIGMDINTVLRIFRSLSYYSIYYVITNLVTEKKQIKFLVNGLFFIAVIVAVAMMIQLVVGDVIKLIPGKEYNVNDLVGEIDAVRLQPPGETLLFVTFMTAIAFVTNYRGKSLLRSRYLYLLIVIGLGVTFTYVRTYVLAASLGVILLMIFGAPANRKRLLSLAAWGTVIFFLFAVVALGVGGKLESTLSAVSGRYLTLFAGKELVQSKSLDDRQVENSFAIKQIQNHPILGIGLGNDYRPPIYGEDDDILYYVHNVYLWLLMDLGIPGFCLFLAFYLTFLVRAWKNFHKIQDDYFRSIVTGASIAGVGILPMALVIPLFMEWHSIVVIIIFIGLSETIIGNPQLQTRELTV